MTEDWRSALAAARLPSTPEQQAWDGQWQRWRDIAARTGRGPNESVAIAYTRTEDQHGKRPNRQEAK